MSVYEWQAGTVKIPTKAFPALYRAFIKGYNDIQENKLRGLKSLYDYIMRVGKGKRNFPYLEQMCNRAYMFNMDFDSIDKLFPDGRKKPLHPTKKMFDFANTRTAGFTVDEGTAHIGFDKTSHTVSWGVPENNHACERAHEQPEAKLLFRLLQNVKYTNRTGGQIVGNDEYNRDQIEVGAGGNYVVFDFSK